MSLFSPAISPSPRRYYRTAIMAFFFVMGLVFASWAIRIPDIKARLMLSDAALGSILLGAPLGEMLAIAPSAWLLGRIGSRHGIDCGLLLLPVCLVMLGLAPSPVLLFAALLSFGFIYNMLNIALNTQAVDVEILYSRSIMATFHGMWSLGGLVGGLVGAFIAPRGIAPLPHFCAILCLVVLTLLSLRRWTLPRPVRIIGLHAPGGSAGRFRMDAYLLVLGFIALGSMATEGAMYDWSSVYFADVIQPGPDFTRVGYVACMGCMVLGRLTADGLVNRFGVELVLRLSGLCIAAGLSLAVVFPHLIPATLGLGLVGYGMASVVPLCYSLAGKSPRVPARVGISLVSSVSFLGFLSCPPLIGFLSHATGSLRWAFCPIIALGLSIALLVPVLRRLRA
ncbi:MFS transporter [uncultured Desulfovibrio sp.]|uniref:MFS transporter n=1 Tax=uncultured Desulfovibrio sp. TaxID=167968 RepID=UPI00320A9A0D